MRMWVPPYWVRRVFHALWLPTVIVLTTLLAPFYVIGAIVAIFPGRRRLLRVVSFAWPTSGPTSGCSSGAGGCGCGSPFRAGT